MTTDTLTFLLIVEAVAIFVLVLLLLSERSKVAWLRRDSNWMCERYNEWEAKQAKINATYHSRRDRIEKAAAKAIALLENAIKRNNP